MCLGILITFWKLFLKDSDGEEPDPEIGEFAGDRSAADVEAEREVGMRHQRSAPGWSWILVWATEGYVDAA